MMMFLKTVGDKDNLHTGGLWLVSPGKAENN